MPKDSLPKLGNKRLDQKMPVNEMPAARTQKEAAENAEYEVTYKMETLAELMTHFDINPKEEDAWMRLAVALAEHYVPGMQFARKSDGNKKWNWQACWTLYALYRITKANNPDDSEKQVFNKIHDNIQDV